MDGVRVRVDDGRDLGGRVGVQRLGRRHSGGVHTRRGGDGVRQLVLQHVCVHRAEHCRAEGAAEGAEEGDPGGGDTEVLVADGVLDDDGENLHGGADPEAQDQHRHGHLPVRGVGIQPGQ